jgi:fucose 4-O-acetylase-like acetyltransferase
MLSKLESIKSPVVVSLTQADRISWVDHARGIAILLVVYRHVVVGMRRGGVEVSDAMYNFQELFYNFRMPVFFVLSGAFLARSLKRRTEKALFFERARTILYPYILWAIIMVTLEMFLSRYTNAKRGPEDYLHIITQPRAIDHLWYLLALFNASALYLLVNRFIKQPVMHLIFALGLHCLTYTSLLKGQSFFSDAFYFYPFFMLGAWLSAKLTDPEENRRFLNSNSLLFILPVFLVGQWFWFNHRLEDDTYFPLFLLINLVACYVVYVVSRLLAMSPAFDGLSYLGRYSLYIYILHVPLMAAVRILTLKLYPDVNPWLLLSGCWLTGLFVPVLMVNYLKPFGFLRLFSLKPASKK